MSAPHDNSVPAFPGAWRNDGDYNASAPNGEIVPPGVEIYLPGMSLRQYAAVKICAALMTATSADNDLPNLDYVRSGHILSYGRRVAAMSWQMADLLLAAERGK